MQVDKKQTNKMTIKFVAIWQHCQRKFQKLLWIILLEDKELIRNEWYKKITKHKNLTKLRKCNTIPHWFVKWALIVTHLQWTLVFIKGRLLIDVNRSKLSASAPHPFLESWYLEYRGAVVGLLTNFNPKKFMLSED